MIHSMDRIGSKRALRWYIREWREYRGLTQDQVAERANTNKGQISKLETGAQRMNDSWASRLADAFGVEPWQLLRHPEAPDPADLLAGLLEQDRERVRMFADALKRTGTKG
jgi:transcriptional regulator with XRE-family HTH domain